MLASICLPAILGLLALAMPASLRRHAAVLGVVGTLVNLGLTLSTFQTPDTVVALPWLGQAFELSLRSYHTASFVTTAAAGFGLLVTLYSLSFMNEHRLSQVHYGLILISLGLVNGAVFANDLLLLLFFWEGLLGTMYGMIALGGERAAPTATKALIVAGVADLCMMFGIGLVWFVNKNLVMTEIHLPLTGPASAAFVFLMIGAISKGGSMPFHSWIPDAAVNAPLPFMAFLPASIEKLLGIYFLGRISLDLFQLTPDSWVSTMLMVIGSVTLLFAVLMALIQKDMKRLLSFHAISQVGYMILGIGTAVPVGIVGGLFHMINHAMYKSCLFLTSGAVERQAKTTDLALLGGLRRAMPITFACFLIAAASISGVPPFNGFFSKELVYDAALERGFIFYGVAIVGSFFTAASFLKLGHAAFFGPRPETTSSVREAPWPMLVPMLVIASACVLFGVYNELPVLHLIQPMLPDSMQAVLESGEHHVYGMPTNVMLVVVTLVVLAGAVLNHWFGVSLTGRGLGAADHIHHSPYLGWIFDRAERRWFDPYELFLKVMNAFALMAYRVDRANDWLFSAAARLTHIVSIGVRAVHTGNTSSYLLWSLLAAATILFTLGR